MARAIGVPASTYREWEYGRAIRGEPYVKMAEVLKVSLYELITGIPPSDSIDKIERIEHLLKELRGQLIFNK
jgi:transcriptional regulator with XRE-family HTH domain